MIRFMIYSSRPPARRRACMRHCLKPAGALYVKESGTYLGKIMGGKFIASRDCNADQSARIVAAAADPERAAVAYGKLLGSCSCCGRELSDPESVARGIGPICAANWGL